MVNTHSSPVAASAYLKKFPTTRLDADTAHGLARRKGEQLQRGSPTAGVAAFRGARRDLRRPATRG